MNLLLVGDLHTQKTNLEETERLMEWVWSLQKKYEAKPIFVGDIYHAHSLVNTEVMEFYLRWFGKKWAIEPVVIAGNHDKSHDGTTCALSAHVHQLRVVMKPTLIFDDIWALPYYREAADFVAAAAHCFAQGAKTMIVHQDFDGAQFANGFYAPNGVKLDDLPEGTSYVVGHIHARQAYDRVLFVGTPRQLTRSDLGQEKGVHIWDTESGEFTFIPTPVEVCEPFTEVVVEASDMAAIKALKITSRTFVKLVGTSEDVVKAMKKLPDGAKVKSELTDMYRPTSIAKESDGIPQAFAKYVEKYMNDNNLTPDRRRAILETVHKHTKLLKG